MKIKIGNSYRIYGKMQNMKKMKPISDNSFCTNLIYADIFTPKDERQVLKLQKEIDYLNTQGKFELRKA